MRWSDPILSKAFFAANRFRKEQLAAKMTIWTVVRSDRIGNAF